VRSLATYALFAALVTSLPACSADAADEPEPTLETPGAFVAVGIDESGYRIWRTLTAIRLENRQEVLFFTAYAPVAEDFAEARELARDPDLEVGQSLVVSSREYVTEQPWKVVWFRTLTDEELSVVR
jgi:hypothetical protein